MRNFFFTLLICTSSLLVTGQLKFPSVDKSPMDMCFYPVNYPILKIQDKATEPLLARVCYSRPQKNGRAVFGELVEYNKLWRLGANEATEIEFFKDVKINNNKLKKGRYTLYVIPTQEKWTIIFNRETDIWGGFKYDPKKDALRVDVPVQRHTEALESFSMMFEKSNGLVYLIMGWDDVFARLPITI